MKNDAYIIGVSEVTVEEVADSFEQILPHELTGYVRRLQLVDIEKINGDAQAKNAQYGYFSSVGEFTYWGDTEEELFDVLEANGLEVYQVH